MRAALLARSTLRRLRHSAVWILLLGFEAAWITAGWASRGVGEPWVAWEFYVPAFFLLGHLVLAAAPWQWTGDDRVLAGPVRGCLQALLWNAAWVLLLLWAVNDLVRPVRRVQPNVPERAAPSDRPQARPPRPQEERRPEDSRPPRPEDRPEDRHQDRPQDPIEPRPEPRPEPPPELRLEPEPRVEAAQAPPPGLRQELKLLFLNLPFAMVLGWFLAGKERAESREEELQVRERQARALALQAQMHPHALYNVLAGLTELVHEDADAAEQVLVGLVELLRMLTRQGHALQLPLAEERALLRRYLAIESMRLGDRLQVVWDWPESMDALELPPLLLQPLVENAIKHGIAPSPKGGELRIRVREQGGQCVLQVRNTGRALSGEAQGTGLSNLRQRLALLPGWKGAFSLRTEGDHTLAEIRLSPNLTA